MTAIALAGRSALDIAPSSWSIMKEQAGMLVRSGFLPSAIKTPEQAMAIMLKGRELGIPAMQAFAHISVIQGKPAIGAELMLALIRRTYPNAPIEIERRDNDGAVIKAGRPGAKKLTEFTFTIEDARRAGLLGKSSWQGYPRNMCFWRAISDMARSLYPECLMGCSHTPEELGADVNEEGEVISIDAAPAREIATAPEGEDVPFEGPPAKIGTPAPISVDGPYTEKHKHILFGLCKEAGVSGGSYLRLHDALMVKRPQLSELQAEIRTWKEAGK